MHFKEKAENGFTLIEIVIFITIMGIIGVTILAAMNAVLSGSRLSGRQSVAMYTATKCSEWYLKQRYLYGFNSAALACPSTVRPSFCTAPTGYTITTNVACTQLYGEVGSNYKTITVSVSGDGKASISQLLANY